MDRFSGIASRLFNTPLALRPDKAEIICAALADRVGITSLRNLEGAAFDRSNLRAKASEWMGNNPASPARKQYTVERRVARISVDGTLVHKLGGVEPYSGLVGFDQLDRIITDAQQNSEVGAILLDIDSPGGEVSGCFDFARKLRGMGKRGGGKPIVAFANEMACSAAYAIAAACDQVMTTETGQVGSIGVWTMVVDMSKGLQKGGVEVTMIRAGERKARGGPYEAADAQTLSKLQDWVDGTWQIFAELVSSCRPLSTQAVLNLRGDWFTGRQGLDLRLVDKVASADAIFEAAAQMAQPGSRSGSGSVQGSPPAQVRVAATTPAKALQTPAGSVPVRTGIGKSGPHVGSDARSTAPNLTMAQVMAETARIYGPSDTTPQHKPQANHGWGDIHAEIAARRGFTNHNGRK